MARSLACSRSATAMSHSWPARARPVAARSSRPARKTWAGGDRVDRVLGAPQQPPGRRVEVGGGQVAPVTGTRRHLGRTPAARLPEADDPGDEERGGEDREKPGEEQPVAARGGLPAGRVLEDQGADGQRGGAADGGERGRGHPDDRPVDRGAAQAGIGGQVPVRARAGRWCQPEGGG